MSEDWEPREYTKEKEDWDRSDLKDSDVRQIIQAPGGGVSGTVITTVAPLIPHDHHDGGTGSTDLYPARVNGQGISNYVLLAATQTLTNKTLTDPTIGSGRFRGVVAANPASLVTNDWWIRSDLGGMSVYYDGTRSLTMQTYTIFLDQGRFSPISANVTLAASNWIVPFRLTYNPYMASVSFKTNVLTTNDANNYWKIDLYSQNLPFNSGVLYHTFNTSGDTAGTITDHSTTTMSNETVTTNKDFHAWALTKSGSGAAPGNLYISCVIEYRLVIT